MHIIFVLRNPDVFWRVFLNWHVAIWAIIIPNWAFVLSARTCTLFKANIKMVAPCPSDRAVFGHFAFENDEQDKS